MQTVYPDYYEDFKCIANKCRHSCCIGWEIDIDAETLDFYNAVQGDFGNRLKANISYANTPHFILGESERCPFLNSRNLCDIYAELGENCLCQICSDHPRFYNELPGRTEAGLGLCCEEAARLIITKKSPVKLNINTDNDSGILALRRKCTEIMQDRSKNIYQRIENMLCLFGIESLRFDIRKISELFERLERLDDSWSLILSSLKNGCESADTESFAKFMKDRETEYEQLICYFLYRHMPKAEFIEDAALYAAFAALVYELIHTMGAVIFTAKGDFTVEEQLELVRLFSSEIEYSDENLDIILNFLETEIFGYCNE